MRYFAYNKQKRILHVSLSLPLSLYSKGSFRFSILYTLAHRKYGQIDTCSHIISITLQTSFHLNDYVNYVRPT